MRDCSACQGFGLTRVNRIEEATIACCADGTTVLGLFASLAEQVKDGSYVPAPTDGFYVDIPCSVCHGAKVVP